MLPMSDRHREPSAEENLAAALADLELLEEARRGSTSGREPLRSTPVPPAERPAWLLPRSALTALPAPEPLIDETLDCNSVAVLAGPTGSGKSLLALQWAAAVASGGSWMRRTAKQGPVVYVAAEGVEGLNQRLHALEAHTRVSVTDTFFVVRQPVNLADPRDVAEFIDGVAGERPRMVIFDTLARCMVGQDENSAQGMGVVIDHAYRIRDAMDRGVVLLVHHTGKDGRLVRGSSALVSGVDTVYQTSSPRRGDVRLERVKRKDGRPEDKVALTLVEVADSVVLEGAHPAEDAQLIPAKRQSPPEELLRSSVLEAVARSPVGLNVTEIRNQVTGSAQRVGRMIQRLEQEGRLVRNSAGRYQETRYADGPGPVLQEGDPP